MKTIAITERQAGELERLLEQYAVVCEGAGDRFTMGQARQAARDLSDARQRVRDAAASPATVTVAEAARVFGTKTPDGVTRFIVPPGIGDIAWAYLKAKRLAKRWGSPVELWPVADQPRRAQEFIELLPEVRFGGYSEIHNHDLLAHAMAAKPGLIDDLHGCIAPLVPNFHLEHGGRIEDWYPEVEVDFEFDLSVSAQHRARANQILGQSRRPTIGIYPAAYSPARSWNFFGIDPARPDYREELVQGWVQLVTGLAREVKKARFVLLGASFDVELHDALEGALAKAKLDVVRCVGEHFGVAAAVMQRLGLLVAFPSGLPIVATLLETPTVWWLPDMPTDGGGNIKNLTGWVPRGADLTTLPFQNPQQSLAAVLASKAFGEAAKTW